MPVSLAFVLFMVCYAALVGAVGYASLAHDRRKRRNAAINRRLRIG